MPVKDVNYVCLRCRHNWEGKHDPDRGPQELTCPKCRSNSVRRLEEKKTEGAKEK